MDKNAGKKQRNQKNQKEGKNQEAFKQRTTQTATEKKSEPQPQRANRRQRNEVNDRSPAEIAPPSSKENQKTEESITIDHSNLKRETEDIAKLTKKFTKREITSNWHRYSAPETRVDIKNTDENGPADFSELLQVPVSRGGHLQLKEEQEWSNASHTELRGYFTLDLKALGQSLATIPTYETLRLPKHLLTVEELSDFDAFAQKAKQYYNPDKLDDPNAKLLTILVQSAVNKECELTQSTLIKDLNNSDNCFSSVKHFTSKEVFNSFADTNESKSLNQDSINCNKDYLCNSSNQNEKAASECTLNVFGPSGIVSKSEDMDELGKSLLEPQKKQKPELPIPTIKNHNILRNQSQSIGQVSKEKFIKGENDVVKLKQSELKLSEPKEKRSSRRESSKCQKNVEGFLHKTTEKNKGINLDDDDDDDLELLLSLKKPITSPVTIKGAAPTLIKESSVLPVVTSTSATPAKPSELDDWLESVLQD